jgi:hypothetical protein
MRPAQAGTVKVPGASLFYKICGSGPYLMMLCGGAAAIAAGSGTGPQVRATSMSPAATASRSSGSHIRCSSTVTCGASAANRLIRVRGEHRGSGRGDAQPHGARLAASDAAHGGLGGAQDVLARSSPWWRVDIGADQVEQPQLMTT